MMKTFSTNGQHVYERSIPIPVDAVFVRMMVMSRIVGKNLLPAAHASPPFQPR